MTARRAALFLSVLLLALPATALAQSVPGIRGYAVIGSTMLTAADSFDAVAGSSSTLGIGGGAAVSFWKGLFVDVSVSRMKVDGERVFVDEGTVFPLGIPLAVTMVPFDLAGGWRLSGRRLSPYAGAGLSWISYKETSDFAAAGEDVDDSGTGLLLLGGVDVALSDWLHLGGEVRYRDADAALGDTGVSQIFGETSIGGVAASVRISVGR
jgi:hypothetical protein